MTLIVQKSRARLIPVLNLFFCYYIITMEIKCTINGKDKFEYNIDILSKLLNH